MKSLLKWLKGTKRSKARRFRPSVEVLEQRACPAATIWDGSESSEWHNADNWSNGVPGAQDDAIVPSTIATTPIVSTNDAVARSVLFDGVAATQKEFVITNTGKLTIKRFDNLGSFALDGNWIINGEGSLHMESTRLWIRDGGITLSEVKVWDGGQVWLHKDADHIEVTNFYLGVAEDLALTTMQVSAEDTSQFKLSGQVATAGTTFHVAKNGVIEFLHQTDSETKGGFTGGGTIQLYGTIERKHQAGVLDPVSISTQVVMDGADARLILGDRSNGNAQGGRLKIDWGDPYSGALVLGNGLVRLSYSAVLDVSNSYVWQTGGEFVFAGLDNAPNQWNEVTLYGTYVLMDGVLRDNSLPGAPSYCHLLVKPVGQESVYVMLEGGEIRLGADGDTNTYRSAIIVEGGMECGLIGLPTLVIRTFDAAPVTTNSYNFFEYSSLVGDEQNLDVVFAGAAEEYDWLLAWEGTRFVGYGLSD